MREGQPVGPVTVVQTTGAADRAGRLAAFDRRPLPIVVRGLEAGQPVERTEYTTCLVRGLSTATDWDEIQRIVVEEAAQIITNAGDSGFRMPEGETLGDGVPVSFPAKLTKLLKARWGSSLLPLTVFATELVPDNGVVLRGLCTGDRRTSACFAGLRRPAGRRLRLRPTAWSTASPPWRSNPPAPSPSPMRCGRSSGSPTRGAAAPTATSALVDDLKVIERLKLFLLNLPHTCLAERWLADGRRKDEMVRELVADPAIRAFLDAVYDEETAAGLRRRGRRRGAPPTAPPSSTGSAILSSTTACPTSS